MTFSASLSLISTSTMESIDDKHVSHEFRFFKVYKNGQLKMLNPIHKVPPIANDTITGVKSKDVMISSDPSISARIFLPKIDRVAKLPLFFHVHGGGFCFESAFSLPHQKYLTALSSEANVIIVSVEYGLFPDRPIPGCYDDSWVGLQWVAEHVNGDGPDPWLNDHADFNHLYIGGDSAGGNICHNLVVRVGLSGGLRGVKTIRMALVHPYFGGTDDDKMWLYMCPSNEGLGDTRLKPHVQDLGKIGCDKVIIFVAKNDHLSEVGKWYYEELKKSEWKGNVEFVENENEDHCFHIDKFGNKSSFGLIKKISSFINDH